MTISRVPSRRAFLQSIGASAAMLPLLNAHRARAATAGPKRLVFMSWPNGIHPPEFWPKGGETDFTFGQILSPMESLKSKMLVLGGLDLSAFIGNYRPDDMRTSDAGWGHDDYLALLTGARFAAYHMGSATAGSDSVDLIVADAIAKKVALPFHSLQIGAKTDSGFQNCITARAKTEGTTPENDPVRLWTKLFQGRSMPKDTFDALAAERKSVLDYLGKDLEAYGKRLGTDDRTKVQAHLASIRQLEQQLTTRGTGGAACTNPAQPGSVDFKANDNYPQLVKTQMDLMIAALKCDLTRVISYNLTNTGGSNLVFSWLGSEYTGPGDEYPIRNHHDIAHQQGRSAAHLQRYIGVNKWYYQQFAYFCGELDKIPEGDGTMLDNTAVVLTNLTGSNHMSVGLPWVVVGSCGKYFRTGRLLKFGDWATKTGSYWGSKGIPHNALLVSLANAMDVAINQVGDAMFGTDPLPGLTA